MSIRWWQSIRWRLALGSALLVLLATALLALVAIGVINYYYGADQKTLLSQLADDKAHNIATNYENSLATNPNIANESNRLSLVVVKALGLNDASEDTTDQHSTFLVFDKKHYPVYPLRAKTVLGARVRDQIIKGALQIINPFLQAGDMAKFNIAINQAYSKEHLATDSEFGRDSPIGSVQPFSVRPILLEDELIGVVVVTARPTTVPVFVNTVGGAVLIASLLIAALAVAFAILFARTITRPLARLTHATRALTSGDYNAQVTIHGGGELGELAQHFNEMAAQLRQDVEELHRQEAWRRELIMNITHDLATPLTAIAGLGESLVDGVNRSYDDYEATGRVIVRETLRLRRLVQDLHVMAKVEAGALHPQKKPTRLAALVDEILAVLAPEFERYSIEPINALSYQLPTIHLDPDMLTRVLSNLCTNALHHTPPGGSVTIDAHDHGEWLLVSVTDTGTGIPEEALSRVFERFFRVDGARQSSTGGSGLGLAIVRAIIEAHGGRVWAENADGAGARIAFVLPLLPHEAHVISDTPTIPIHKRLLHLPSHVPPSKETKV